MGKIDRWAIVGCLVIAGCGGDASTTTAPVGSAAPTASPTPAASASPSASMAQAPSASPAASTAPASPAPAASAAGSSGIGQPITDPAGDAKAVDGAPAPGYLDAVGAEVSRTDDGTFTFTQRLATALPAMPILPTSDAALGWSVCVDVDPAVSGVGYPMRTFAMPCEFIVHTRWDGTRLSGLLIDRWPLATGGSAQTTTFEPVVDGTSLQMVVPADALGDPATFRWSMFTEELGELGTDLAIHVDAVPDGGIGRPIDWPPA